MGNKILRNVTAEYLKPKEVTYQGSSYSPITHKQVIDTIGEYLYKNNFKVRSESYLSASEGQKAIGRIGLDYGDNECGFELSFRNSLDGSMSFGLAAGTRTWICSNGSVYGDMTSYKRKHSGDANQEILFQIQNCINIMEETINVHLKRRDRMKELEISKKTISELCGRLYIDNQIITSTQLSIIKNEIENPSFNYDKPGSVWQFYNHCTHSIKETTPMFWHKVHSSLGNFFVENFNIKEENERLLVPEVDFAGIM